jgi:hypothetical protein
MARKARKALVVLIALSILVIGALAAAPAVGRWYIRSRVLPALGRSLGRAVGVGEIDVRLGRVNLRRLTVTGPADPPGTLLASIPEVRVAFSSGSLLSGKVHVHEVVVEQPRFNLVRSRDGKTNFLDLLRRGGGKRVQKEGARLRIDVVRIRAGGLSVDDARERVRVSVDRIDGEAVPGGRSSVRLNGVAVTSPRVNSALRFSTVELTRDVKKRLPQIGLRGGEVQLLPRLRLTGIRGRVSPEGAKAERLNIDLEGSYGGAEAKLWSAEGWLSPATSSGQLRVRAERFSLGRIASILTKTPVIMPQRTLIDGRLDLGYRSQRLEFRGKLEVQRLSLFHPRLAWTPVLDLEGSGEVDGSLDLAGEKLTLGSLKLRSRGLEAQLSGTVERLSGEPHVALRLTVPELPCQAVLDAFPPSLVPALQGFKLKGKFAADLHTDVDFEHLDRTELGGKVGIRRCKVTEAPEEVSADRLEKPFEHQVEPTPGGYVVFSIGPDNESYTPFAEISPNIVNAFLTTEDAGFFRHHGFIPSMFEKALARNLKRGGFRLGASTISMQMVKNVLLTHRKTLSRKLQELFLTWYLEQELSKERIMEIYLNAIEFGPGIYGIGAATRHYFGKLPKEITPLEAAFFASILPSPKRRYVQYCRGTPSEKWDKYVRRILRRMASKGFVSEAGMAEAESQSLTFNRDLEALSEKDCLEELKELLESWDEENVRRLREAVLRSAPHQVDLFVPPEEKLARPPRK